MTHIAVVILNYNGQSYLEKFMPALIRHSEEATIYVADNCSTDDSLQILQQFPEVEVITLDQNFGYAGGYNEALRQIKAHYYVLVNSDVEVTSGWLNPMVHFLEANPEYAAVQPKLRDYNQRDRFEYAGAAGGYLDQLGYPYCRGRVFDDLEEDIGQYDQKADIFWATGACFMIRAESFHKIGGFDSAFFAHMEEIDLCWRLQSEGYSIACIPQSTVYHVGGGTLHKTSSRKTYLNYRNGISLLIKNVPKKQLIFILPARVAFDWASAIKVWKTQSSAHAFAIFRAHFHALKEAGRYSKIKKRSKGLLSEQQAFILPVRRYLFNKRTFSALNNTR